MERRVAPDGAAETDEVEAAALLDLLRRRQKWLVASVLLGLGAGLFYLYRATPVYRAQASIRLEEQAARAPIVEFGGLLSPAGEVATELQVLSSRSLAEEVVDSLGLRVAVVEPKGVGRAAILRDVLVESWAPAATYELTRISGDLFLVVRGDGMVVDSVSPERRAALPGVTFRMVPGALAAHDRARLRVSELDDGVRGLRGAISVSQPSREANILVVSFQSSDTSLVAKVPNLLVRRFIERRHADRRLGATNTVRFLEEQVDSIGVRLAIAEEALTAFREGEQVVSLQAEADAQVAQLARLQAERNTIEAERSALQTLVDEIQAEVPVSSPTASSPYTRLMSFPSLLRNQATSELLRTLNQAVDQRSQLLVRRTLADPDVENLTRRIREIEDQLRNTAVTYLRGLTNQVEAYDRTLVQFGGQLEVIPAKDLRLTRLDRERRLLEDLYSLLETRLNEARIAEAAYDPSITIVDPAIVSRHPVAPRPLMILLLSLSLGALAGAAVVVLKEVSDRTIHTPRDVADATGGAPVLGTIPIFDSSRRIPATNGHRLSADRLVMVHSPRSPIGEAYRSLRTNLTFIGIDRPKKALVVTSAIPQDGKSTTASNLAIALSQQGIRTLLVDGDLRRGVLASVFGVPRSPGLTTVLQGNATLESAIAAVKLPGGGSVSVLASGEFPPNPAEVLGSRRMKSLLDSLREAYDFILIDAPPVAVVTDAAVAGQIADGVLMVVRAGVTEQQAVRYAFEQMDKVSVPLVGTVINGVDYRRDSRYYSGYGSYSHQYGSYFTHPDSLNGDGAHSAASEPERPTVAQR